MKQGGTSFEEICGYRRFLTANEREWQTWD
jgi:hypothetical protein